ncbi:putative integral membrane protein [Tritrichomonas foetus]|uniref:Integral membrane protein n=1 Tax=Tritrichomonas foetus TaxID=1144522 RepID=A0A1J4JND1_9EUKA|nr:putative integral membrane protein [Tritrichomonas foetus]|eukprot:OHT00210.1 putative integral membrane protein [Tritrichomonas foetus]
MMKARKSNKCRKNFSIWVLFGMALVSMVTQKILYMQESLGTAEYGYHRFLKPWFKTTIMFFSMTLSFIVYFFEQSFSTIGAQNLSKNQDFSWKHIFLTGVPAICDLLSTIMSTVSMMYLGISIVMILNCSKVIFTAFLSSIINKKSIYGFQWFGISVMVAAIAIVSMAAFFTPTSIISNPSKIMISVSIVLKILSQLIFAIKVSIEEHLTQKIKMNSSLIVAIEGIWGFIICCFICLPIVNIIPGKEGGGFHENTKDTIMMIKNSRIILLILVFEVALLLLFNICCMTVVETTDAVMAVIYDLSRTAVVWMVQIIIFYIFQGTVNDQYKAIGEKWTKWSWIQLFGFLFLSTGILIYKGAFTLKCFDYSRISINNTTYQQLETFDPKENQQ